MNYGLHIIKNPSGTFSFVGSVPVSLMDTRKPTTADVMGGRVDHETGLAYVTRTYQNVEAAIKDANSVGAKLCTLKGCACRKLFLKVGSIFVVLDKTPNPEYLK